MIVKSGTEFTAYVIDKEGNVLSKDFDNETDARFFWAKKTFELNQITVSPWAAPIEDKQTSHIVHVVDEKHINDACVRHTHEKGVLIGCSKKVEWLLEWWWNHYSKHNDMPVAFVDLGLSTEKRNWCMAKGTVIDFSGSILAPESNKTFDCNCGWKPFGIFFSPFKITAWIDLDCEVRGNVEPIFEYGQKFAIAKDSLYHNARRVRKREDVKKDMQGEIMYNAGVLVVHQDSLLLRMWMDSIKTGPDEWRKSDQPKLQQLLTAKPDLFELLPQKYNYLCPYKWFAKEFGNLPDEAVILHRLSSHKYSSEVMQAEVDNPNDDPQNHAERLKYHKLYHELETKYQNDFDKRGYGAVNHGKTAEPIILTLKPDSICDVGCGQGNFCIWAAENGIQAYGVDIASVTTGHVIEHPGVTYIDAEAKSIPLPDKSVDYIVSFDCLEHCLQKDIIHIFKEFARIARKGFVLKIVYTEWEVWDMRLHMTVQPEKWWLEHIEPYATVDKQGEFLICTLRDNDAKKY